MLEGSNHVLILHNLHKYNLFTDSVDKNVICIERGLILKWYNYNKTDIVTYLSQLLHFNLTNKLPYI